jgi:Protein of unknown function (DUF2442)
MLVPLDPTILDVMFARRSLCVEFADGRSVCAPLEWFPILAAANPADRDIYVIEVGGGAVSWPNLGERVTSEFFLAKR